MPKKQKRFHSEKAILKAIDTQEQRRLERLAAADALEDTMRALRLEDFPSDYEFKLARDWQRKLAKTARHGAQLAAAKKIELGKALARYRTIPLPLDGNKDSSVTL